MRLIDADELKEHFSWSEVCRLSIEEIKKIIDYAPTVEPCKDCEDKRQAEYIRHGSSWHELQSLRKFKEEHERPQGEWGKWVISEIRCPNCLEYFQTDCYSTEELKKCPNCGVEMKGGAE